MEPPFTLSNSGRSPALRNGHGKTMRAKTLPKAAVVWGSARQAKRPVVHRCYQLGRKTARSARSILEELHLSSGERNFKLDAAIPETRPPHGGVSGHVFQSDHHVFAWHGKIGPAQPSARFGKVDEHGIM
jgi:hypothetical protein